VKIFSPFGWVNMPRSESKRLMKSWKMMNFELDFL
jgi:hypothetical protein